MNLQNRREVNVVTFENGRTLRKGQRVRVKTRHGTIGTGVIVTMHEGAGPPVMAMLKMDEGTVYAQKVESGWPDDETRIREFGLFGGEIQEILSEPAASSASLN